jgi:hypothetical protein
MLLEEIGRNGRGRERGRLVKDETITIKKRS